MTESSHPDTSGGGWRPVPDPTVLTTEALLREIEHLRDEITLTIQGLHSEMTGMRTLLDERYATQTKALDAAFVAAEKAVSTALESADRAVSKAEIATDKRFESVNEFRAQLTDQANTFLLRSEADVRLRALGDRITRLEEVASTHLTRTEYGANHETLRQSVEAVNAGLAEHKTWDISVQGKLQGEISSLKSRYAGVSVALGVIMTVIIVLITVVELTKK